MTTLKRALLTLGALIAWFAAFLGGGELLFHLGMDVVLTAALMLLVCGLVPAIDAARRQRAHFWRWVFLGTLPGIGWASYVWIRLTDTNGPGTPSGDAADLTFSGQRAAAPIERLLAFIIDCVLAMLVAVVLFLPLSFILGLLLGTVLLPFTLLGMIEFQQSAAAEISTKLQNVASVLLVLIYLVPQWTRRGTSVGKQAWDLVIVGPDGRPPTVKRALLRAVALLTLWWVTWIPWAVRRDRRALHDLIAETFVVTRGDAAEKTRSIAHERPGQPDGQSSGEGLANLPDAPGPASEHSSQLSEEGSAAGSHATAQSTQTIRPAPLDRRLVAWLIDVAVLSLVAFFGTMALLFLGGPLVDALERNLVFALVWWVVGWPYYALQECSRSGATLGKRLVGLQVTDLRGQQISFRRASVHYWARVPAMLAFWLGYALAAVTPKLQTLHDLAAGCVVVQGKRPAPTASAAPPAAWIASQRSSAGWSPPWWGLRVGATVAWCLVLSAAALLAIEFGRRVLPGLGLVFGWLATGGMLAWDVRRRGGDRPLLWAALALTPIIGWCIYGWARASGGASRWIVLGGVTLAPLVWLIVLAVGAQLVATRTGA